MSKDKYVERCRDCGKEENIGFGYCRECAIKRGAKLKPPTSSDSV